MSLDAGRVGVRADQVDIHGRVTSPSFLNELLEDLPEWTDMPVWVNGTEELLPSNNSVPVTSPILADIAYPDIRRDNQYFTYRESPTIVDGLAKIKSIKGNTLNWNQIYNVNSDRTSLGVNIKVVNGAVSITGTSTNAGTGPVFAWTDYKGVQGHKYIITKDFALPSGDYIFDQYNLNSTTDITTVVFTLNNSGEYMIPQLKIAQSGVTYNINGHLCVYDLTKMFGAGNEPTTVEEFKSLFPLSYSYNQGSLLSFMGNGIKTVGFNQWDEEWEIGNWRSSDGQSGSLTDRIRSKNYIEVFPNTDYYFKSTVGIFTTICWYDESHTFISSAGGTSTSVNTVFRSPVNAKYMRFNMNEVYGTVYNNNICINISSSRNGEYEPYTSHTTNLPISTYFPTGMKSAGSVYDELTPRKAITRIGAVDMGSLNWTYQSSSGNMYVDNAVSNRKNNLGFNAICSKYQQVNEDTIEAVGHLTQDKSFAFQTTLNGRIIVRDTSYTDATVFKQAMADQNVKLYYELATPVELPTLSLGE